MVQCCLDMVGLDRTAAGVDIGVAAGCGRSEMRPRTDGAARKCSTGSWWCRTDCRHSASVTNEAVEPPAALDPGENQHLGDDAGKNGQRRASTRWQNQKKLNGPKNTGKQNWINTETKRIEAEIEKLAEVQENIKARKETLRVVYEEIKKLRMELVQEANRQEQKSCAVSGESGRSAKPRTTGTMLAGASGDATTEEIASWFMEARPNRVGEFW